ncbi:MAG: type II toxin-antitoxin system RelE family toxin [Roseiarcus sp.]
MKSIVLGSGAAKSFDKLTADDQRQVSVALHDYAMRGVGDVRALVGTQTARLQVGDFRIIFDEDADKLVVLALGHRKDIYR